MEVPGEGQGDPSTALGTEGPSQIPIAPEQVGAECEEKFLQWSSVSGGNKATTAPSTRKTWVC